MKARNLRLLRSGLSKAILSAVLLLIFSGSVVSVTAQAQQSPATPSWDQLGIMPWPMGGMRGSGMMGNGMMGTTGGSMARHHFAMMNGVPAAYRSLSNPLPRTRDTVDHGGAVYAKNCSGCHGATGAGDGPAGQNLSPRPADLQLLAQIPMVQWDGYMFWTVSEGGAPLGSAMPAFKGALSDRDRWSVIAYIQAHLPQKSH